MKNKETYKNPEVPTPNNEQRSSSLSDIEKYGNADVSASFIVQNVILNTLESISIIKKQNNISNDKKD